MQWPASATPYYEKPGYQLMPFGLNTFDTVTWVSCGTLTSCFEEYGETQREDHVVAFPMYLAFEQ